MKPVDFYPGLATELEPGPEYPGIADALEPPPPTTPVAVAAAAPDPSALFRALVELHNAVAERVHRSPTLRLLVGSRVLALLKRIEVIARAIDRD